jgi:hypothetical protein
MAPTGTNDLMPVGLGPKKIDVDADESANDDEIGTTTLPSHELIEQARRHHE